MNKLIRDPFDGTVFGKPNSILEINNCFTVLNNKFKNLDYILDISILKDSIIILFKRVEDDFLRYKAEIYFNCPIYPAQKIIVNILKELNVIGYYLSYYWFYDDNFKNEILNDKWNKNKFINNLYYTHPTLLKFKFDKQIL